MDSLIKLFFFTSVSFLYKMNARFYLIQMKIYKINWKLSISKANGCTYLIADDQTWSSCGLFGWNQWTTTTWWARTRCQWTFPFTKWTLLPNHLNLWCIDWCLNFRHFNRWNILHFHVNPKQAKQKFTNYYHRNKSWTTITMASVFRHHFFLKIQRSKSTKALTILF